MSDAKKKKFVEKVEAFCKMLQEEVDAGRVEVGIVSVRYTDNTLTHISAKDGMLAAVTTLLISQRVANALQEGPKP